MLCEGVSQFYEKISGREWQPGNNFLYFLVRTFIFCPTLECLSRLQFCIRPRFSRSISCENMFCQTCKHVEWRPWSISASRHGDWDQHSYCMFSVSYPSRHATWQQRHALDAMPWRHNNPDMTGETGSEFVFGGRLMHFSKDVASAWMTYCDFADA